MLGGGLGAGGTGPGRANWDGPWHVVAAVRVYPLGMSLLGAFKWSYAADFASKTVQPLVFLILARLLTPEDFGVVAAATMVISFSQVFWEAGMGKALIQRQENVEAAADIAFWVNMVLALLVVSALFTSAPLLARRVFQDDRVADVLRVMSILVALGALGSVQMALLQKAMAFRKLFWLRLMTVAIPGAASIPLALGGYGYWALVIGTLVGQCAQVALLWTVASFRPRWRFPLAVAIPLSKFGLWVAATGLLGWFYVWADSLIVGMYLGAHELGLFRTGNLFVIMIFGTIFAPLLPVLYSHLSKRANLKISLKQNGTLIIGTLSLTCLPVASLIFLTAPAFESFLFGPNWLGISKVIGIMALMHGISWVVGANGELYRASGRPQWESAVIFVSLPIYISAYLAAIQISFDFFLWTRLALAIAACSAHLLLAACLKLADVKIILTRLSVISILCALPILASFLPYVQTLTQTTAGFIISFCLGLLALAMIFIAQRIWYPSLIQSLQK